MNNPVKSEDLLRAYGHCMEVRQWAALEGAPPLKLLLHRLRNGVDPETAITGKNLPQDRSRSQKRHSQYRGVTKHQGGFLAQIKINGRVKQVGPFETDIEAAKAFDKLARKHGRRPNFPQEGAA